MKNLPEKVRAAVARIQNHDRKLSEELKDVRRSAPDRGRNKFVPEAAVEGVAPAIPSEFVAETIVLRVGRPVWAVVNDEAKLEFHEVESEVWRGRLTEAREKIGRAVKAVGRIELRGHPFFAWVGTGWLVAEDIIVTNRHVAREFGRASQNGFVFKLGLRNEAMTASIDFLEEFGRNDALEFSVKDILHIEDEDGPDMAFLQVRPEGAHALAERIDLASTPPATDRLVAVIGYPARDSRIPDQALMQEIFGDVYDKKRLAPGQITAAGGNSLEHDCSTLGGNSGSVVLDLEDGNAVGLHFAGRFLQANYAVPAHRIAQRLHEIQRGELPRKFSQSPGLSSTRPLASASGPSRPVVTGSATVITINIPVRISAELGAATTLPVPASKPAPAASARELEDDEVFEAEARPADYSSRSGYKSDFLEDAPAVELPEIVAKPEDVLTYELDGEVRSILPYEHFSVVMSISRRLCFFSAVNINGKESRKFKRKGWRTDPRISIDAQTKTGVYGNEPKFARGHMTRREDPIWGDPETASLGNTDSMHLTNAVPQMQPFNAGIWLGLEDYALDNAREDKMQISVFTGPFLFSDDPVRFGVKVPRSFWKIIVFVHDETNQLCATGYTLSQEAFLREEEFVFGQHDTAQIPIARIEEQAGLSFGQLRDIDPMAEVDEALPTRLTDFRQIRFVGR